MTHAIWWPVNDIHHVYSQKPCMFTFHCKGSLRQRRWYKVEEFSEKSDRPGRCSFDILFCKSVVFHQISALWVMIIRVILWRSCSPWWPEMDTVLRSVRYHSSSSVQLSTIQEQWIIKGNSGDWLVCMCLCLQVQESFAACALDVKRVYDENRGKPSLEWSNSSLSHVASLLLRANKTQHAWWERQLYICLSVFLSVHLQQSFYCHMMLKWNASDFLLPPICVSPQGRAAALQSQEQSSSVSLYCKHKEGNHWFNQTLYLPHLMSSNLGHVYHFILVLGVSLKTGAIWRNVL